MILRTKDGLQFSVTKEQAEQITNALSAGAEFLQIGQSMISASMFGSLSPGGDINPGFKRLSSEIPGPELTPEQLAERAVKFREMWEAKKKEIAEKHRLK